VHPSLVSQSAQGYDVRFEGLPQHTRPSNNQTTASTLTVGLSRETTRVLTTASTIIGIHDTRARHAAS
jgi:hypothetical protein